MPTEVTRIPAVRECLKSRDSDPDLTLRSKSYTLLNHDITSFTGVLTMVQH